MRPSEQTSPPRLLVEIVSVVFTAPAGHVAVATVRDAHAPRLPSQLAVDANVGRLSQRHVSQLTGRPAAQLRLRLADAGQAQSPGVLQVTYAAAAPTPAIRPGVEWLDFAALLGGADRFMAVSLRAARDAAGLLIENGDVAAAMCGTEFTLSELRAVYETIWDVTLDAGNFQHRVLAAPDFLKLVGARSARRGRPAATYGRGDGAALLMRRPVA